MKTLNVSTLAGSLILLAAVAALAAPVTTVPWNGKTGAVSFTYDDARTSQIPNLIPQLDSLGIKATFFISIQNIGDFNARRAAWIQAARNGHELTNHTYAHANVNGSDGVAVTAMIKDMADTLRGVDTSIQSVTFAYPNCNLTTNATAKNGISAENFMARGCANPTLNWGTQPSDWMNIPGEILGPTSASSAVSRINAAKTNNRWYITILHDVGPNPDQYSMTPANNRTMLEAAVAAGVWIDTYERIGSYYRAHFVIDTAKAVVNGTGWKVEWVSPHARMPRSVPLRVRLDAAVFGDSAVVVQNGVEIARNADSTYVVDFMKLRMDVYPKGTVAVSAANKFRQAALAAKVSGKVLRVSGLPAGAYAVALHDAAGKVVARGGIRVDGPGEQSFSLKSAPRSGLHQLSIRQGSAGNAGPVRRVALLILQ
jgi:peptidoglycan/xylan/chitin deacetylase (PgdA/CDA1 family)